MQFPCPELQYFPKKLPLNISRNNNSNVLRENIPSTPLEICLARIEQSRNNNQNSCTCILDKKEISYLQNEGFKVTHQNLWELVEWKRHS